MKALNDLKQGQNLLCAKPLLKSCHLWGPIRLCAFQSLEDWIAQLLSCPGIEDLLDESLVTSQVPYDYSKPVKNIHDSQLWKVFIGPDGSQYTTKSGNLAFVYGNKTSGRKASITIFVLPTVNQMNSMLCPLVDQLQSLWKPSLKLSSMHQHPGGCLVHSDPLNFLADLVALRQTLGFGSVKHTQMCFFCFLKQNDKKNIDLSTSPHQNLEEHNKWAFTSDKSTNLQMQAAILSKYGI
ncbi:hypothetical protein CROQUDRAFT_54466 [Cronartium quercuum f. sp. fusiforme G11]|uniref:Uncharacterized protein n=1 Tax=Cronartium quercuum f. sp. fusiforme G11 TaxID=708437 RepID=A0A9P6N8G1_9BASI|nr:hypothetical protein CROQUDRAFT_54466 [Cronartium quercuum f. sp. fusiforme G11]